MKSVKGEWEDYRRNVIPADAPEVQLVECRRAFYAGAVSLMRTVMTAIGPEAEPTDEDVWRMQEIMDELRSYMKEYERR